MPVNPEFVPLDTAKTWAKRLQRTSKTQTPDSPWPLTRCQLAVAQMLGFEHWHALSKALTVAIDAKQALKPMPAKPVIAQLPSNPQDWGAFWHATIKEADGLSEIHIETRTTHSTLRLRLHGQLILVAQGSERDAAEGLASILPKDLGQQFLADMGLTSTAARPLPNKQPCGYVRTTVHLEGAGVKGQMTWLPVYPQGWDAVIQLQDLTLADYTLADMNLPEQVTSQLANVAKRTQNSAGMVFCGSAGTGKTRLMQAVVSQFTHEHAPVKGYVLGDPPEFRIPHLKAIPVGRREPEDLNENNPGGGWQRATHSAMRGDPDVLVIGEVRDEHSAKAMFQAMDSGIATFTTLHSTSGGVIERLKAFDDRGNWAQRLAGWAHTRLLGLLCPECSLHCGKPGRERKKGKGCAHCGFVGLTGRQLVVDVWEMDNGTPTQASCMLSQARELVRQGLVDRESAIDALGPLEGPKAR